MIHKITSREIQSSVQKVEDKVNRMGVVLLERNNHPSMILLPASRDLLMDLATRIRQGQDFPNEFYELIVALSNVSTEPKRNSKI